jgi:DNA polymerase II small subunit
MYIPDPRMDPLVIEKVPDLFFAGHIHKAGTLNYRGITLVSASCFQSKTDFQEKVGHDPEPGVVPVVDLNTRQVIFMRF